MNLEDNRFGFRFVCKDFEIEIRGDQRFVDKVLSRYENRVMLKLREFLPLTPVPVPEPRKPEPPRPSVSPPTPHHRPEAAPPQPPAGEKKPRRHRGGRGRRGKRHPENPEGTGQRVEREPELFSPTPDLPGENFRREDSLSSGATPESSPVEEPGASAFTHPPLGETRPSTAEFPSRRRVPKVQAGSLKALLEEKRPRTHHDRIMLMGYHLENAAGGSDFIAEELMECYQAAGETPPANLNQVLNHATRSGFILRHDQGRIQRFKLSARGRRYLEDGLKLL